MTTLLALAALAVAAHSANAAPMMMMQPVGNWSSNGDWSSNVRPLPIPQFNANPSPMPYYKSDPSPMPYYNLNPSPMPYFNPNPSPLPYYNVDQPPMQFGKPQPPPNEDRQFQPYGKPQQPPPFGDKQFGPRPPRPFDGDDDHSHGDSHCALSRLFYSVVDAIAKFLGLDDPEGFDLGRYWHKLTDGWGNNSTDVTTAAPPPTWTSDFWGNNYNGTKGPDTWSPPSYPYPNDDSNAAPSPPMSIGVTGQTQPFRRGRPTGTGTGMTSSGSASASVMGFPSTGGVQVDSVGRVSMPGKMSIMGGIPEMQSMTGVRSMQMLGKPLMPVPVMPMAVSVAAKAATLPGKSAVPAPVAVKAAAVAKPPVQASAAKPVVQVAPVKPAVAPKAATPAVPAKGVPPAKPVAQVKAAGR